MGKQKSPGGVPSGLFCFSKLIQTLNELIFISQLVTNINTGNGNVLPWTISITDPGFISKE